MFDHYVSLGFSCSTASSMAKHGLRAWSGPFDWLITRELNEVLRLIETGFTGFLNRENLSEYDGRSDQFIDHSNGIIFKHEGHDYQNNYHEIVSKYERRIQRFTEAMFQKICFLRAPCKGNEQSEIDYVVHNEVYIRDTINKYNSGSEIVFLITEEADVSIPDHFPFRHYRMHFPSGARLQPELRAFFDGQSDFLQYCYNHYSTDALISNLRFDLASENRKELDRRAAMDDAMDNIRKSKMRYNTLIRLLDCDFSSYPFPDELVIFGAGNLGKKLYEKISKYTKVMYFLDSKKTGECCGVPIISLNSLKNTGTNYIVVSTTYDFEHIRKRIASISETITVISLDTILDNILEG